MQSRECDGEIVCGTTIESLHLHPFCEEEEAIIVEYNRRGATGSEKAQEFWLMGAAAPLAIETTLVELLLRIVHDEELIKSKTTSNQMTKKQKIQLVCEDLELQFIR